MIDPTTPTPPAGTKRFEVHDLRRIPVSLSDAARLEIFGDSEGRVPSASAEGRKVPQALSEAFGQVPVIARLEVDAVPRSTHFASGPEHYHPVTGREERVLVITAYHQDDRRDPHTWYVNVRDLHEVYLGGPGGFRAHTMASELVRLYPYREGE
jgi:hypothetical protein